MGRTSQNRRSMPSGYFDSEDSLTSQYRRYMPAGDSDDEDSCEERGIWLQSSKNGPGRTNKPDRATAQSHNSNILAKLQDTRQYIDEVTSFLSSFPCSLSFRLPRYLSFYLSTSFLSLQLKHQTLLQLMEENEVFTSMIDCNRLTLRDLTACQSPHSPLP